MSDDRSSGEIIHEGGPETGRLEPSWSSELSQRLYELVSIRDLDSPEFEAGLRTLESEHPTEVYAELLYLLSHLRFEAEEARRHWQEIGKHRDRHLSRRRHQ